MVRDSELDQLKSAMDAAFERMNAARNAMDLSWSRRSNLCDQMNAAYERLSPLRNRMEQTWQDLQDARDRQQRIWESMDHGGSSEYERLTELINEAKSNADAAYANAQDAFQNSRSAYDSHDGAAAKEYSEGAHRYLDECHGYNDEFQRYVEERREVARQQKSGGSELREAKSETDRLRSEHERLHSDYVSSKFEWQSLRERYLEAKAENERDTVNYKSVKADFDHAHDAYIRRRDLVQSQREHEKDSSHKKAARSSQMGRIAHDNTKNADFFGSDDYRMSDHAVFWPPVHTVDEWGCDITIAFGKGDHEGETLICDGHVSAREFWGMKYIQEGSKKVKVKRHDHYMPDGSPAGKHKNRGNYTGDLNRD